MALRQLCPLAVRQMTRRAPLLASPAVLPRLASQAKPRFGLQFRTFSAAGAPHGGSLVELMVKDDAAKALKSSVVKTI